MIFSNASVPSRPIRTLTLYRTSQMGRTLYFDQPLQLTNPRNSDSVSTQKTQLYDDTGFLPKTIDPKEIFLKRPPRYGPQIAFSKGIRQNEYIMVTEKMNGQIQLVVTKKFNPENDLHIIPDELSKKRRKRKDNGRKAGPNPKLAKIGGNHATRDCFISNNKVPLNKRPIPAISTQSLQTAKEKKDQHITQFLWREEKFQSLSSMQRLLKAARVQYEDKEFKLFSCYKLLKLFGKEHPELFSQLAFEQSAAKIADSHAKLYGSYGVNYPLCNNIYGLYLADEFSNIAIKQFGHLSFTMPQNEVSSAQLANREFARHRYFKGTSSTKFPFVYENVSREKLGNILGIEPEIVAEIELFIENIADKLGITINGERVPNKQRCFPGSSRIKKQTWNKKPDEVKNILYGVAGRALYKAFGFEGKIIELFVKKIASNVAQNNFKRLDKNRGMIVGKANKVFRRNSVRRGRL